MTPKKKAEKAVRKARTERRFPAVTFQEALVLAKAIQDHAGGQKVRRMTLFEKLDQSPDTTESRRLITGSNQYGLTKGRDTRSIYPSAEGANLHGRSDEPSAASLAGYGIRR